MTGVSSTDLPPQSEFGVVTSQGEGEAFDSEGEVGSMGPPLQSDEQERESGWGRVDVGVGSVGSYFQLGGEGVPGSGGGREGTARLDPFLRSKVLCQPESLGGMWGASFGSFLDH